MRDERTDVVPVGYILVTPTDIYLECAEERGGEIPRVPPSQEDFFIPPSLSETLTSHGLGSQLNDSRLYQLIFYALMSEPHLTQLVSLTVSLTRLRRALVAGCVPGRWAPLWILIGIGIPIPCWSSLVGPFL